MYLRKLTPIKSSYKPKFEVPNLNKSDFEKNGS